MSGSSKYKNRVGMWLAYMGGSPIFIIISMYLVYFYTNVAGLNPATIGTILLVSRVLDGLSDVFFGSMIDRTRTKMGVCRPWLFRMSVFGMIGAIGLFCVPSGVEGIGKYIFVFVSYNFANTVVATIYQLSYIAFPSYLERDTKERSILYIWGNAGQTVTQFIMASVTFKAVAALGGGQKAWIIASAVIGVTGMVLTLTSVYLCREKVNPDEIAKATGDEAGVPFLTALKACVRNKYFWQILIFVTFGTGVYVVTMTMTPYYAQYILGDTAIADTLNAFSSFPMMITMPLLVFVVAKLGKKNIAFIGACLMALASLITIFAGRSMPLLCAASVIKSVGLGCPTAVYAAMLSDAIEYGQWKTGIRTQAVLMGGQNAGGKIGIGFMSAFISWTMALTGFQGTAAVQTPSANNAIIRLYSVLPTILAILMIIVVSLYDLDKRFPQIMKDLEERAANKQSGKQ